MVGNENEIIKKKDHITKSNQGYFIFEALTLLHGQNFPCGSHPCYYGGRTYTWKSKILYLSKNKPL